MVTNSQDYGELALWWGSAGLSLDLQGSSSQRAAKNPSQAPAVVEDAHIVVLTAGTGNFENGASTRSHAALGD